MTRNKDPRNINEQFTFEEVDEKPLIDERTGKFVPEIYTPLRNRIIHVPNEIYKASGIKILGKRIKSLIFTTDVALLRNNNADSVIAVYPFTPSLSIIRSIIDGSSVPVFTGVGGGLTTGKRAIMLALEAEMLGAYGVVVNAPMENDVIKDITASIDVPLIATVVSFQDDYLGKIEAGARILNVSGGKDTSKLVMEIRSKVGNEFPIIATGGNSNEKIANTIRAGANAITYTPPTTAEIFSEIMEQYRDNLGQY